MTEHRDIYLLTKSTSKADSGNPLNRVTSYSAELVPFCRVNEMGYQQQTALFAGKVYADAKVIITPVMVDPNADKIAFFGEYDPETQKGTIYDITMPRTHTNSTAFYIVNTKGGLVGG